MQKELSLLTPWSNYCIVDMKFRIVSYYGRSDGAKWEGADNIQIYFVKNILLCILYDIFSNIMLDLSDTELNLKAKFCNDLLSVLDDLNCGDCRKRGKFI